MASPIPGLEAGSADGGNRRLCPVEVATLEAVTPGTYWRTLRHLRRSQLGYLALRRLLPRSNSPAKVKAPVGLRDVAGPWWFFDSHPETSRKMLAAREFTFLNRSVRSTGSIPWNDRRHAKLWLYHLNYFDFVNVGFVLPDEEPILQAALEIMQDWCRHNSEGTEVGWEPYALSVRIINWLKFLARHGCWLGLSGYGGRTSILLGSLGCQVATLEHRLEKDLLGNHFLKNIKALLFAGAFLDLPRSVRRWAKGEELLEEQLNEQILGDGGHFERSPMYHSQVLEDLVEIQLLCAATGMTLHCSELIARKIRSMAAFLRGILHPDGNIPLFNDSTLDGARHPKELLALAEPPALKGADTEPRLTVFPDTGYAVIRNPESLSTLIFDCGPLGPDYQPGHGHCDLLSYELSLEGQRVVVDTGVHTYERGPERHYERSTAAHNTLRINGEEQAEIWASFRVGQRPCVDQLRGASNGVFHFVRAEHDGYRRLGVMHARKILWCASDTWVVADFLRGSGTHHVESFLHFHPSVHVRPVDGPEGNRDVMLVRCWQLEFAGQSYTLVTYGEGRIDFIKSWYSEQFGDRQAATVLRWTRQGRIPDGMVHAFIPAGTSVPQITPDWPGESIAIDGHKIPLR